MTFLGTGNGAEITASQHEPERIEQLSFEVAGTAVPQGSKDVFSDRRGGWVMVEANKALPAWRKKVRDAAELALAGRHGFGKHVPVILSLAVYMPRPKSVRRPRPSTSPDLDKICRSIGDALTDAGVWVDDGQVVELHAREFYADDQPHTVITVSAL